MHGNYVVMVPSWPLEAQAIVMTLDITNKMAEAGKYLFSDPAVRSALDDNWEHTQLRVVRCQGVVVYRAPGWRVLTTSLPTCTPLHHLELDKVGPLYECQQIRSYKSTAVILFTEKKSEQVSCEYIVNLNVLAASMLLKDLTNWNNLEHWDRKLFLFGGH